MNPPKTRLLIVDDHPLLLAGLSLLLNAEPDMEVVGQADSAAKALTLATELQPDVVLLDISLHNTSGLALLPDLAHLAPGARIVMLTMHEDQQYLKEALSKGAKGFLLKKGLDIDLLSAVRAVMRGEKYIHPALMTDLLASQGEKTAAAEDQLWHSLSQREQQVVLAVARGFTSKEIATRHFLSEKTVATYRARAMAKLGLETRAELVEFVDHLKPDSP